MPFLVRGKARARQNKPPAPPPSPPPPVVEPVVPPVKEEEKIAYQEVNYRVPKEERLLDLPLEEEVFGEENINPEEEDSSIEEEGTYNIQPVGQPVSIGIALKKKKRRL
jgi:hypothetical protein